MSSAATITCEIELTARQVEATRESLPELHHDLRDEATEAVWTDPELPQLNGHVLIVPWLGEFAMDEFVELFNERIDVGDTIDDALSRVLLGSEGAAAELMERGFHLRRFELHADGDEDRRVFANDSINVHLGVVSGDVLGIRFADELLSPGPYPMDVSELGEEIAEQLGPVDLLRSAARSNAPGWLLRQFRDLLGFSRPDAAELFGLSVSGGSQCSTLRSWENENKRPGNESRERLARIAERIERHASQVIEMIRLHPDQRTEETFEHYNVESRFGREVVAEARYRLP